jgi:tRNA-uridine 2-sulfurtransferase
MSNTLIVGEENDARLFRTSCTLTDMNWLCDISGIHSCQAQIRYRQAPQDCQLTYRGEFIDVVFSQPQRAITPGQVCALYQKERVLGSGIII